ncbi:MAG: hypothetical protein GY754_11585 [bacterium]|nr:hypothetical protein [bacterium]
MFDEEFIRTWRFYLLGAASSFRYGNSTLYQVVFTKNNRHDLPLSRDYLYHDNFNSGKIEKWE